MKPIQLKLHGTVTLSHADFEGILGALVARLSELLRQPEQAEHNPPAQAGSADGHLSVRQLAARWQMHPESIRRMVRGRRFAAVKIGNRVRIPWQEVVRVELARGLSA